MIRHDTPTPAPAPLPYRSQAGRGEIPTPPPADPVDQPSLDPDAPLLREDELALWCSLGAVAVSIALMVAFAWLGGL